MNRVRIMSYGDIATCGERLNLDNLDVVKLCAVQFRTDQGVIIAN